MATAACSEQWQSYRDCTLRAITVHVDCGLENPKKCPLRYGWTLRKNVILKGLGKILRVSWTAEKIIEWVLNHAGVKRELLDTV